MSKLRKNMLHDMIVRGLSKATQYSYLRAVEGLANHYDKPPNQLSEREVQDYLVFLSQERGLAYSSCNVVTHGLRFFFRVTLARTDADFYVPCAKLPSKLPELLSQEEVRRLLTATTRRKDRAVLMTAYSAGLRLSELVHLKVTDINSDRMTIRVEQGKGGKDRYTILSMRLLQELRDYWREYRPKRWLFPGRDPERHICRHTPHQMYHRAKARAGIVKYGGIHSLRHAFATHLLDDGANLYTIQRLLGHSSVTTTIRYFHLSRSTLADTHSPLDLLELPKA